MHTRSLFLLSLTVCFSPQKLADELQETRQNLDSARRGSTIEMERKLAEKTRIIADLQRQLGQLEEEVEDREEEAEREKAAAKRDRAECKAKVDAAEAAAEDAREEIVKLKASLAQAQEDARVSRNALPVVARAPRSMLEAGKQ